MFKDYTFAKKNLIRRGPKINFFFVHQFTDGFTSEPHLMCMSLVPLFHPKRFTAGSEPEPNFELIPHLSTAKEPDLSQGSKLAPTLCCSKTKHYV